MHAANSRTGQMLTPFLPKSSGLENCIYCYRCRLKHLRAQARDTVTRQSWHREKPHSARRSLAPIYRSLAQNPPAQRPLGVGRRF